MGLDELDNYSGVPFSKQILAIIERRIREGVYEPGSLIPSRKRLSQDFGVGEVTAYRVQEELTRRGYLVRQPGIGLVVTQPDRWPAAGEDGPPAQQ